MTMDYVSLGVDVAAVIAEFGVDALFTTTISAGVVSQRTKKVVFAEQVMSTASDMGDSGVKTGDWELLVESGAVPIKGDVIVVGTDKYQAIFVSAIKPANYPVAYTVYARFA